MLGVLTVNTGTPAAPQARDVRQFLRRFLSDPRVVELPRWLWLPLLHGLVLPLRSPRSARNYRRVGMDDGSPLAVHSRRLRTALEIELDAKLPGTVTVESAFLYSEPQVREALQSLRAAGAQDIVVLPLYPQASGTTTGPVYDQVAVHNDVIADLNKLVKPGDQLAPGKLSTPPCTVRSAWRSPSRFSLRSATRPPAGSL